VTAKARVAVLYTRPATVLHDYQRLFELAGGAKALESGTTTILKDNISWHYPMPSANTTPWQMEGVILALRQAGFDDLVCVQNKTVVSNAVKGAKLNLYVPVWEHHGIPVLYNYESRDMTWVPYKPQAEMLILDEIYPKGIHVPDFFLGKNIVHLPTVKCHMYTTTTGAIKNAFGGLLNTHRHYTHTWIHETLVDLLAIQQEIHPGIFAVMDGTTAGNGPGPRTMEPVVKNVLLASSDQVAIDAVAAKLMGFDPLSIDYIRLAHERGLGVGNVREIQLVGDDLSGESWGFEVGYNFHRFLAWMAWFGPTNFLQKLICRTPLVAVPILISKINHDYTHWPFKERHVYEQWQANTSWGQLFQQYRQHGHMAEDDALEPPIPGH
jgi:uncharacterized protein (DUF362 family)